MNKNSKFLKTILTTASTFALALGVTTTAEAGTVKGTTSASHTGNSSWYNGTITTATFSNNDSILLEHSSDNITLNGNFNVEGIDLNEFGAVPTTITGVIEVSATGLTLGSIGNGQGSTMSLLLDDGQTLILNGTTTNAGVPGSGNGASGVSANDYSGLGAVTLGNNTAGGASILHITPTTPAAITFANTFDSNSHATGNYGIMNISGGNHTFNGVIGGNKQLDTLTITDTSAVTFTNNVTANTITLAGAGSIVILKGGTITADIQNTSGSSSPAVSISDDVTLAGSIGAGGASVGGLNLSSHTLTIDTNAEIRSIYVNNIYAPFESGILNFSGANDATIYLGSIELINSVNLASDMTLGIANATTILAPITTYANGKGRLSLTGADTVFFMDIGAQGKALAEMKIASDNTITMNGAYGARSIYAPITTSTPSKGIFAINGGDVSVSGDIGTSGAPLKGVNLATDNTLTIDASTVARSVYAPITTFHPAKGTFAITGGDVTIYGDIGTSLAPLKGVNFASDNTLTIDASTVARSIYAPITTFQNGAGTFAITGGNVSIYGDIGASEFPIKYINFATNNMLTIDTTAMARSIYVDHITNNHSGDGILNFSGTNGALIQGDIDAIRGVNLMSDITLEILNAVFINAPITTSITNKGHLYLSGSNATLYQNIGTSLASLAEVQIVTGNMITMDATNGALSIYAPITTSTPNQGSFNFMGGTVTIFGNIGAQDTALAGLNLATNNTILTISGYNSIYSPITTYHDGHGILSLTDGDISIYGNIGALGKSLAGINFATDNSLLITVPLSIYAPITSTANATGELNISGGDVAIYGNIGTSPTTAMIKNITIITSNNLTVTGNIYSQSLDFNDFGSQLTVLGGTSGTPNVVSASFSNVSFSTGQGIINVGDGNSASYVNFTGTLGIANGLTTPQFLKIMGNSTAANASTATISANSFFYQGSSGASGIFIGQNATLNVASGATLTFSGATIEGVVSGSGTLILNNVTSVPVAVGGTTPLGTVRLDCFQDGYIGGGYLGNPVYATNLDLTNGSVIVLDTNVSYIMNFISSDHQGRGVLYKGKGALTISNITVPLALFSTGTLTASNVTEGVDFLGTTDNNPNLILANNASIANITIYGGNAGTLTTQGTTTFTGTMGGTNGTYALNTLTFTGTANQIATITTATDIYALDIVHNNVILDTSANNITMHGNYSTANNATLTVGDKTLTVDSDTTVTLAGTLVVNATYTGTGQIILDFSAANSLDASALTALTLNIDNGETTPPPAAVINVIKTPASNITLPTKLSISLGTSDTKWSSTSFGVLTYYAPPVISITTDTTTDPTTHITTFNATTSDGTRSLDLVNNGDVQAYTNQYPTSENQKEWLGIFEQTVTTQPDLDIKPSTSAAFGTFASQQGLIPSAMANALIYPEFSGTSSDLIEEMTKVAASRGESEANEMIERMNDSANNAVTDQFNNIGTRLSFLYIPNTHPRAAPNPPSIPSGATGASPITAPISAPSATPNPIANERTAEEEIGPNEEFEASAYGMAAGSSPYDRFGIWVSVNAGCGKQDQRKGEAGFKSVSNGFALGVDTMINDRTSIGVTVSNSSNHIKHRDNSIGDKTDSSSWVGAIYGNYQLQNNWFLRGAALFNRTHMNSKELRVVQNGYGIAQAKYNIISYGGEASVGFGYRFQNDLILTPTIGLRVLHNNKSSFGQNGNTAQNNKVSSNAMNNYSALGGLSLAKTITKSGIDFTPEAHVNLQYGVNMKSPKGQFVSALTPNQTTNFIGSKASPFTSTYGISLTGSSDRIECGITGDVSIADKYVGYQGSVKLKIKF